MTTRRTALVLLLALALPFALHGAARADTYEIFSFTDYSGAGPVVGMDDAGDVVYRRLCTDSASQCFSVFQPFGPGYNTDGYPLLDPPLGDQCPPLAAGTDSQCNNGFYAFFVGPYGSTAPGLFAGTAEDIQRLTNSISVLPQFVRLDAYGDVAWTDGGPEVNHLAYDLTSHVTPEPGALLLVVTGLAGLGMRRWGVPSRG